MDYNIRQVQDEPVLQVEEPVAVYGAAVGQSAEPWVAAGGVDGDFDDGDDEDDEGGGISAEDWLNDALKHPEFVEYLQRSVAKCDADIEAGRTYSHEEVWAEFEREYPQWYGIK